MLWLYQGSRRSGSRDSHAHWSTLHGGREHVLFRFALSCLCWSQALEQCFSDSWCVAINQEDLAQERHSQAMSRICMLSTTYVGGH